MSNNEYFAIAGGSASASAGANAAINSSTANSACTSSRWLTEEVFRLIDMVKSDEAIYNPRHKYYFCRPYVENFWRDVDLKLEKNPGASLAKWTNLRISFRREYTNYLEEKVPPCWSYFDRMFFLHPYLRKKHQTNQATSNSKSLDSQVQDALAQLNTLSKSIRDRAVTTSSSSAMSYLVLEGRNAQHGDNYMDYYDEAEQNNSEIEEIMEAEEQMRFKRSEARSLNNDIKSEYDDNADDYEVVNEEVIDEHEDSETENIPTTMATKNIDRIAEEDDDDVDAFTDNERIVLNNNIMQTKRQQMLRFQHFKCFQPQPRDFIENNVNVPNVNKRPPSRESISSSSGNSSVLVVNSSNNFRNNLPSTSHSNTNVPATRVTPLELVSTTTTSQHNASDVESVQINRTPSTATAPSTHSTLLRHQQQSYAHSNLHSHQQHQQQHQHHHPISYYRNEVPPMSSTNTTTAASSPSIPIVNNSVGNAVCDCKTDPDAMFLMSLLPDIQKLNGRDRGKIKIAFQNTLQAYLYPD